MVKILNITMTIDELKQECRTNGIKHHSAWRKWQYVVFLREKVSSLGRTPLTQRDSLIETVRKCTAFPIKVHVATVNLESSFYQFDYLFHAGYKLVHELYEITISLDKYSHITR